MSDLSKVTIGIRTFLRDAKLFTAIDGIRRTMSEAQIIIADCGEQTEEKSGIYSDLQREGHKVIILDFDAGFGSMSNAIADALDRPYLLIGSDDFLFDSEARKGIEKLVSVIEQYPELHIVSGRVNNKRYEFFLDDGGDIVAERVAMTEPNGLFDPLAYYVDLTVNYCLVKKEVFSKVRWDAPEPKIGGGEHGSWFLDVKRAGLKVGFVAGVNINEQAGTDSEVYKSFRNRARMKARPCFDKRGIKKYILGDGRVDYDRA